MKNDYFVDFMYHDQSLKNQDKNKFIINKFKESTSSIKELKLEKVREADNFIALVNALELELKEFKKLLPTLAAVEEIEEANTEKVVESSVRKAVAKKSVKKVVKVKKPVKQASKPVKNINELRLGLQKIRDELSRM